MMHALYPNLTTVGEVYNSDPTVTSYFAGGQKHVGIDTGLATQFDFPSYFALRSTLTGTPNAGSSMANLENVQRQDWLYPHPETLVTFFGNHDTARFLSDTRSDRGQRAARLWIAGHDARHAADLLRR